MEKCPCCGHGPIIKIQVMRDYEGIFYEVPVEQCETCKEVFSGWQASLVELQIIKAAVDVGKLSHTRWDKARQYQLERLLRKKHDANRY